MAGGSAAFLPCTNFRSPALPTMHATRWCRVVDTRLVEEHEYSHKMVSFKHPGHLYHAREKIAINALAERGQAWQAWGSISPNTLAAMGRLAGSPFSTCMLESTC